MKICNVSLYAALRDDDINAKYEIKSMKDGSVHVVFKGEIAKDVSSRASNE